jgi:hypothetical protein
MVNLALAGSDPNIVLYQRARSRRALFCIITHHIPFLARLRRTCKRFDFGGNPALLLLLRTYQPATPATEAAAACPSQRRPPSISRYACAALLTTHLLPWRTGAWRRAAMASGARSAVAGTAAAVLLFHLPPLAFCVLGFSLWPLLCFTIC